MRLLKLACVFSLCLSSVVLTSPGSAMPPPPEDSPDDPPDDPPPPYCWGLNLHYTVRDAVEDMLAAFCKHRDPAEYPSQGCVSYSLNTFWCPAGSPTLDCSTVLCGALLWEANACATSIDVSGGVVSQTCADFYLSLPR